MSDTMLRALKYLNSCQGSKPGTINLNACGVSVSTLAALSSRGYARCEGFGVSDQWEITGSGQAALEACV